MSASGVKRTSRGPTGMSAFDPKRTSADDGTQRRLSHEVWTTTCSACGPSGPTSSDGHRDSAHVPSGHASSFAPTVRPSNYRGRRWRPQEAGGSVPLGWFRTRPQKPDLQFRSQIPCAAYVSPCFLRLIRSSSRPLERLINSKTRLAVPWMVIQGGTRWARDAIHAIARKADIASLAERPSRMHARVTRMLRVLQPRANCEPAGS